MASSLPYFDFSQTTDYQGFRQRDLNICLIVFSTVFVFTRLYVRAFMTKKMGLDDSIIVVAYLLFTVFSGLEIRAVSLGSGAHMDQIPEYFLPPFYAALATQHLMYFWSVGLMRLAIVAFLLRLAQDRPFRIVTFATAGVILVQTIVCFVFRLSECKNISDLWRPPGSGDCLPKHDEAIMMYTHAAIGIAIDIALLVLPIWVVKSSMMNAAKAVQVVLIFCAGIFVVITGIVRLAVMARTNFAIDTTHKMATVAFWTDLEGHVGLWVACFPALQPLFSLVSVKCGFRSMLDSRNVYGGTYGGKASSRGKSGKYSITGTNSSLHSRTKNGYLRSSSGFDGASDTLYDSNSQRGIVTEARAHAGMEMDDFADGFPGDGEIKRTIEVRIQVDDNADRSVADKAQGSRY
ncbi:hypothetical protein BJ170DRAFT_93968 [Xylariales sp. AK1849]|nr:hypothetical protein BJ170DRAFT_93968 [Xylariales sp. AK1849]